MDELKVKNGVGSQNDFEKSPSEVSPKILKDPSTGRFLPGNGGRRHGSLGRATIARQMVISAAPELVRDAIRLAKNNASMMATLLSIAMPNNRSQLEAVQIPGLEPGMSLEQKTEKIMTAVTDGILSADTGLTMVSGLRQAEEAQRLRQLTDEISDLKSRVIDGRGLVKRIN